MRSVLFGSTPTRLATPAESVDLVSPPDTALSEEKLRSRRSLVVLTLVAAILFAPCHLARALSEDADLREEIVLRCHYEMGEFGVEGVRLCVEADNSALSGLSAYPEAAKAIVSRCTRQMRGNGWAMVKVCVDKDLAAEAALAQYPAEKTAVIELCRAEIGKQGPAQVKACADQRISAEAGPGKP